MNDPWALPCKLHSSNNFFGGWILTHNQFTISQSCVCKVIIKLYRACEAHYHTLQVDNFSSVKVEDTLQGFKVGIVALDR